MQRFDMKKEVLRDHPKGDHFHVSRLFEWRRLRVDDHE